MLKCVKTYVVKRFWMIWFFVLLILEFFKSNRSSLYYLNIFYIDNYKTFTYCCWNHELGIWDKLSTRNGSFDAHLHWNKITSFDHADIYGGYTTKPNLEKHLRKAKSTEVKFSLFLNAAFKPLQMLEPPKLNITIILKKTHLECWKFAKKSSNWFSWCSFYRPSPLMQADEIAEAIFNWNRRKNYRFWTIEFYTISIGIDSSEVGSGFNQIQFSATHLEPMLDGSLDYMQLHNIRPMSWNPLGTIF
jgi:predicted oxidoreductase